MLEQPMVKEVYKGFSEERLRVGQPIALKTSRAFRSE